jgi:2-octaprenylphenol hydroxylase
VWSTAIAHAETLMGLSEMAFIQKLGQAFDYKLGEIESISLRKSYPLHMQHVQQYAGSRWVIMGDAAHTIHPLAGLGLNMGLADLTALLQVMDPKSSALLTPRALRAYQRQRKHELWQMILFLQGIHRLFTQVNVPMKVLRRFGLNICDRLPMLKRVFMEQASGVRQ